MRSYSEKRKTLGLKIIRLDSIVGFAAFLTGAAIGNDKLLFAGLVLIIGGLIYSN